MESNLSREVLKAHNATEKSAEAKPKESTWLKSLGGRERAGTLHSESSSGTGKLKLQRLRHKIKLFGGSFSKSGSETQIQKRYENTYRLEPTDTTRFSSKKAEDIISHVLENYLKGKSYDPKKFPNLCKSLAELIKDRVKSSGCTRYKLIAHVMILENQGQSMRHVSRCLWNKDVDDFATATYETNGFTAVGSVFATYYD
ncbi:hypothetical protein ACF0H5_003686 [Mactra antiquata]